MDTVQMIILIINLVVGIRCINYLHASRITNIMERLIYKINIQIKYSREVNGPMKISVKKEKAIVFITSIAGIITGYVATFNPIVAGIAASTVAAVLVFWSEGINTEGDNSTPTVTQVN